MYVDEGGRKVCRGHGLAAGKAWRGHASAEVMHLCPSNVERGLGFRLMHVSVMHVSVMHV